ncbi:hypothetical protein KDA_15760 [Dictyobacter alpinus]|uniref:Uncharacterized protein n=1 Tax=Dictyobacter alpinus TaxID=2014873 RepID=A0A402B424_9CHLR|nr:hypothetical protein [Dictyobacter alpinus]GCE26092.1 hypothetical protein KDA_15760 [Dictyobacter alpinus]
MQMFFKQAPDTRYRSNIMSPKRRRFSPFLILGSLFSLIIILGAGAFLFLRPSTQSQAKETPDQNMDCSLIVPPNPLTAAGLATPYQLVATKRGKGKCHEDRVKQAAFVQGAIFDPQTNQISIYNPLVVDRGDRPAIAPVVPKLPQGAVVGLWFGFNGENLTLKGDTQNLAASNCVNGLGKSVFGQFAYCNAPQFFSAANQAISAGKLTVPGIGMANDGMTCPTVRDFGLIDMDQSDNVNSEYLIDQNTGRMAQNTAANAAKLTAAKLQVNGSDNRLLSLGLDSALNCTSWSAPDLANPGHNVTALPLNELQAAAHQAAPMALVPAGDPMAKVDDKLSLSKLNLYRAGVNQPQVGSTAEADTSTYCQNFLDNAPARIFADRSFTVVKPSADVAVANNLFSFLAQRFNGSWGENGLNCQTLLKLKSPIKLRTQGNITVNASLGVAKPVKKQQQDKQTKQENGQKAGNNTQNQQHTGKNGNNQQNADNNTRNQQNTGNNNQNQQNVNKNINNQQHTGNSNQDQKSKAKMSFSF